MKKIIGLSLILAFLPTLGCSESPAKQAGINSKNPIALRILPLGDSITQANSTNMSYRYWLWQMLQGQNIAADFVGTQDSNHDGNPSYPATFDRNHQGHWGWRADQVLEKLPQWLSHYQADISLIHLGTNDCLNNQPVHQTLGELEQIVSLLRQHNPDIGIVFSTLGPSNWQGSECLSQINTDLEAFVGRLNTADSQVLLSQANDLLDLKMHLYDGLHPNAAGEKIIAAKWLEAIKKVAQ